MNVDLDHMRTWCYDQWKPPAVKDPFCNRMARVVTLPLLAIATFSTEVLIPIRWAFHYIRYSRPERLKREYEILKKQDEPRDEKHFVKAGLFSSRNRFRDILPNEQTRVKLDSDSNFYFNANWVLGGKAIACQGPIQNELAEFWNMISKTGITTIVSLANPIEKGQEKCADFWSKTMRQSEELFTNGNEKITHRKLCFNEKEVDQYHLQNWPDFGVVGAKTLAKLVSVINEKKGPILVHCSAGVGRTGTFLAALEAYQTKSSNIFRIAKALRSPFTGRVGMIQTPDQYVLVHDTVKELFKK